MMEAVKAYPDRLIGLATMNPVAGKASDTELERCFAGGLQGVGEISADAQGFRLDDDATTGRDSRAPCRRRGCSSCCCTPTRTSAISTPARPPPRPVSVYSFLEKFPDVTTVLAHWGGGLSSTS